ncbi:MAG: hypothetical protein QF682_01650 [Candidatus Thermoplasmatota archaeon]|nr:hypothetical protein [Candidatus Thermoplasmatota archaeon]
MTNGYEKKNRSRSPPKRRKETILIDDQWLTRDQIATKIQEMMAAGNTKIGKWADALDNLDARLMVKAENKLEEATGYLKDNKDIIEDISNIKDHIGKARGFLGEKQYETSLDESFEVIDRIDGIRHERYSSEVGELLNEIEEMVNENREMGMDVSITVSIINKTRNLLAKKEYEEALELSQSTGELVRSTQKEFLKNKATSQLSRIKRSLDETRSLGLVTDDIETRFTTLNEHYDREEFRDFLELAGGMETVLKETKDRKNAELLNLELQEFISLTEKAREIGVGIDKERSVASRVDELIQEEGYISAINTIKGQKKSLEDRMRIRRRRNCTQRLRKASRELTDFQKEAKTAFPDMQECRDLAFDALEKEDYNDAEKNLDRFYEAWDQHKLELRLAGCTSELTERLREIDAITLLNIDLPDAADIISRARDGISSNDFESVDASISELDSIISEAKGDRAGELAADQMETSRELLAQMKEKGIDVNELEAIMEEAGEALAGSDNLKAYSLAMEVEAGLTVAKTGALKKATSKLLDEVKILQTRATELWLDMGDVPEKADEAKNRFEDGDYSGAKKLSEEVRTRLTRMLNEKQLEIYQFRFDELSGMSHKAREMKVDISHELDRMSEIEKLGNDEDYDEAIEIIKDCKKVVEKKMRDHEATANEKQLEKAEDELLALEKATGRQFEDLGGLLDMVSSALDDGDYSKMSGILDDFYRIKSGYDAEYAREKYTAQVERVTNEVESLKILEIDLDDAFSLVKKAEDMLSEENFDVLEDILPELGQLLEHIRTKRVKKKTGLIVKEINILFKRLMERGTELDSDKELFNEIVHAIKANDYPKACKLAINSKRLLLKKDKRYTSKEVGTRVKEAKDLFEKMKDQTHLDPQRVDEFKSILKTVEAHLEANELDRGQEALSELTDAEEEMVGEMNKAEEISSLQDKVNELVGNAEKLSIDIEDENGYLDETDGLLANYELDGTIPLLKEVYESLLSKIGLWQRDECKAAIEEAQTRLEECEDIMEDRSMMVSRLDRARQHLEAEEFDLSLELSHEILKEIEGTRVEQWENEIRELLRSSDKLIKETQEMGGDTARVEAIYYKATYYLEKRDHENGKKYASMALDRAMKGRMALDTSAAAVLVDEIRAIRDEAESKDIETDVLDRLVSEAEGHVEEARQEEITVLLARAREESRKAEVSALLRRMRELIEKGVGLWIDVDDYKVTVEEAEEAYEKGDFDLAANLAGDTVNALAKLINSTFREKMELQGKKMVSLLKKTENLGLDTRDESRMLSGIRKMKEEGRYEEATNVLLEAISSLERKNDLQALESAREGLEELEKTAGLETDDLNTLMEKADKALSKGNRKGFAKILDDFHSGKERFVRSLSLKKYSSEITDIETQLDEFEGVGLDVSVPRNILGEVEEALTGNRLDDAKEGLSRLNDIMKDIRLVKIQDLAWENFGKAEESIEETLALHIDVSDGRQLLRQARRAMRQGDYIKGTSISSEVRELCERLRKEGEGEEHSLKIGKARQFLEKLRKFDFLPARLSLDMERAVEAAEVAQDAGKTDELRQRIDDIKKLETATRDDIEKIKDARAKLDELKTLLEEATRQEIDITDDKEDMEEAGELLNEENFQELFALLKDIQGSLTEKIEAVEEKKAVAALKEAGEAFENYRETLRDTEVVETRMAEIKELLDGRRFEEARSISEDLINSMEVSREKTHREELEAALDRLWEYISENEKLGIDTSRAEGLFYKSKYFTEKSDYENANISMNAAKDKAEEGRKEYEREHASASMEEVENLMTAEAGLGIDFSSTEEEMDEANDLFDQGKYRKSWKLAEEIMADLTERITGRYLELISQGKEALNSLINKGKGLGAEMEEGIARLPAVDELRDESEYRKALEQIVDIRALTERQIAARLVIINSDKLEDALAELQELEEESGNKYEDLHGTLADARKAFEGADYDELDSILAEFGDARAEHNAVYLVGKYSLGADELESVVADLTKLGLDMAETSDISSEIRESIEDRDFNAVTKGLEELGREITDASNEKAKMRAKEVIGVTNKLFTEMKKLAVDVKRENKMFKEVLVAVRNRDYVQGIRLTLEAKEGLLHAKREHYREKSSETIGTVEASIDEGRELNIDVTRVEELHGDAMELYGEEDYEEAFKMIDEALSTYGRDRKIYFRDKAGESMELLESLMNQAGGLWIDVDDFQDIYEEVKGDYDEERYEEILEKAEGANSDLTVSIEEKLLENIGTKTGELVKIMEEARGLDVDTGPERELLSDVDELKEEKKYTNIIDLLDDSRNSIEEKIAARLREINSDKLGNMRKELEAFEDETGEDHDDLWKFFESAEKAFNESDYRTQDSIIKEFGKAKADHYRQYLAEKYDKKARELLDESEELEELGLDLAAAGELLETVQENVENFDFSGTEATIDNIKDILENARTEQAKELAKEHFIVTKKLLGELKGKEVDLTEENKAFRLAIAAIKSKDFVTAWRLTRQAEEMARTARGTYYREIAEAELEWSKDMVIEGVDLDLDMELIHECLEKAEEYYEGGEYEKSIHSVGEARSDFQEKRTAYWKERADEALDAVRNKTKEGFELGLEMDDVRTLLTDAESYFEGADYEEAIQLTREAEDKFTALRTDHYREQGRTSIALLDDLLGEGSELGLDTAGIQETHGLVSSFFDQGHYERAIDVAEQAQKEYQKLRQTHFRENTDAVLEVLKKMIGEASEFDVDISAVKENLRNIRSLYEQEKFQETFELSEKSRRELRGDIDSEQLSRLSDELSGLEEEMERARGIDADINGEEEGLSSVEEMKAEGSYRDCIGRVKEIRAATNKKYDLKVAEINAGKLEEAMNSLENFIEETGGEYPGLDELTASAGKALEEMDYASFEEVLERFRTAKKVENQKYLFTKYEGETKELESEMPPLVELGLGLSNTAELVASAREHMESNEFEKVVEALAGIRAGLAEARNVGAKDLAKKHFLSTKAFLGQLRELGIVVEEFDIIFTKAIGAIKGRDFVTSCQLFFEAQESMVEARREYYRENTEETVGTIKKLMDEAAELELNTETFTELDDRVRESYEEGEFEEAHGLAVECSTGLREAVNAELVNIIEGKASEFEGLADAARNIDADLEAEKGRLVETARLREKERFREIIAILEEAISLASLKIEKRTFEMNEEKIKGAKEALEELEFETGENYPDLHSLLEEAGKALAEKDYSDLGARLLEFGDTRERLYISHLVESYNERIAAVEEELGAIREAGIEVPDTGELSGTAREAINGLRFDDAKEILEELDEIIDDAKRVKAKQIAKSNFTETNKLLTKLKRLGIDLTSEEKVFREILGAIKSRDFLKSIQLTRGVRDKLDTVKREHSRKRAVEAIQSLEGMLGDAGKRITDVISVEKIHNKAMEHFEEEDFDNALLMVGQAKQEYEEKRKEFQSEMLTGSMDRLQDLISDARELDIDIGNSERNLDEMKRDFANEKFDSAEELAGDSIAGLESTIEKRYLVIIEERGGELTRAMEEGLGLGVDMKVEKERLSAITDLRAEKQYKEIIVILEECGEAVTSGIADRRLEQYMGNLRENQDSLEGFREETGEAYEDLDSLLDSARTALDREDYEAMEGFIEEFKTTKESHNNRYVANGYAERFGELEQVAGELEELGLSLAEALDLLMVAKENAAAFEFDGIEAKLSDIEAMVERARSVDAKKLARKHFISSKELISEMKTTGVGLEEENRLFREAVTAIKAGEFVKGARLTQRSEKLLREKREHYYIEATETELETVDGFITEARELGLSMDEIVESTREAREFLDERLYPQALTLSRATAAALREILAARMMEILNDEKGILGSKMDAARNLGIDIESVMNAVNMAEECREAGDLRKAIELLRNEMPGLDEAMKGRTREIKERAVEDARKNLAAFVEITGTDYPDLEGFIEKAAMSFEDNNYEETDEHLGMFSEAMAAYERELKAENYRIELRAKEPEIAAITDVGIELTDIFELVSRAAELISRHDFETLEETLALIDAGIEEARKVTAKDAAKERITAAKELFDKLMVTGLELREEKALFGEVLSLIKEGDFVKACKMADGANEMLGQREKEYQRTRAEEALMDAEAALAEIRELDLEAAKVEKSLGEARVFYEWKDYLKSEETARATVERAEFLKEEYRKKRVFVMIEGVEEALKEGVELGIDISSMAVEIADAYGLVNEGNLEEAERLALETKDLFLTARKQGMEEKTTSSFETARNLMENAVELGLDTVSIETMLEYANIHFEDEEYESALELITQSNETLVDMIGGRELEKADSEIAGTESLMEEAGKYSVDVGEYLDRLTRMKKLRNDGAYSEIISIGKEIRESLSGKIDLSRKEINSQRLSEGEVKLEELARETGMDQPGMSETLNAAREALEMGDHEAVEGKLHEFDELMKESHQMQLLSAYSERLDKVSADMVALGEAGIDVVATEELLANVRSDLNARRFEAVDTSIEKIESTVHEASTITARKLAKEYAGGAMKLFTFLGGHGIDLQEEKALFSEVRAHVISERFIDACHLLIRIRSKLKTTEENYYVEQAGLALQGIARSMSEARELELDVGDLEPIESEARAARDSGLFQEALEHSAFIKEKLGSRIGEVRWETVVAELTSLEPVLEEVRAMSMDIGEESAMISEIEALKGGWKFREALEIIAEVKRSLWEKTEDMNRLDKQEKIDAAARSLSELEGMTGKVYDELHGHLSASSRAIEEGDHAAVASILEEFHSARDSCERSYLGDSYGQRFEAFEEELARMLAVGIELSEAVEFIAEIKENISSGNLDRTDEGLAVLGKLLEEARGEGAKEMARTLFAETKQMMIEMKESGVGTENVDGTFRQAVVSIKNGEFLAGCELLLACRKTISMSLEAYYEERAHSAMAVTDELLSEAVGMSIELDDVLGLIENSRNLLVDEDFRESHEISSQAVALVKERIRQRWEYLLSEKTEEVNRIVQESMEFGIEVREELGRLGPVAVLKEEGRYGEALELVETVGLSLSTKLREGMGQQEAQKLSEAELAFKQFQEMTGDESEVLGAHILKAGEALAAGDHSALDEHLNAFSLMKEEQSNLLLARKYQDELNGFQELFEEYREAGLDISPGMGMISDARSSISENSFGGMQDIISQLDEFKESAANIQAKEIAKTHLREAKELLVGVRALGVETESDGEIFHEVLGAVRARDFVSACRAAVLVKKSLTNAKVKHLENNTDLLLEDTANRLAEAGELGLDVAAVEDMIGNAHLELREGKLELAANLAKDAKTNLDAVFDEYFRNKYLEASADAESILADLKTLGVNCGEAEEKLVNARLLFDDARIKEGFVLVKEIAGEMAHTREDSLRERAVRALEAAKEVQGRCSELGLGPGPAEDILMNAQGNFEANSFSQAFEQAEEAGKILLEAEEKYLKKDTSALISTVWKMMGESSEMGLDLGPIEEKIGMAQESLKEGDLEKCYSLAIESRKELSEKIDAKLLVTYDQELDEISRILAQAEEKGAGTDDERTMLAGVEELKATGNYVEAVSALEKVKISLVEKIELIQQEATATEIREKISSLEELERTLGRDLGDLKGMLLSSQEAVGNKDIAGADAFLRQFDEVISEYLGEVKVKDFQVKIAGLGDSVDMLEEIGLDVSRGRELMSTIMEGVRENDLRLIEAGIPQIEDFIQEARTKDAREIAKQHIVGIKRLFGEMKANGIDTSQEDEMLKEVVGAIKEQDFVSAIQLTIKTNASLSTKRDRHYTEDVSGLLTETRVLLGEGGELGLNTSKMEGKLAEGQEHFENGEFQVAAELARQARDMFEKAKQQHYRDFTTNALAEIQQLMIDEMELDVDMVAVEDMVANAKRNLEKGNFESSAKFAEEAKAALLTAQNEYSRNNASAEIESVRAMVEEAEKLELDVSISRQALEEMDEHFNQSRFRDAREVAKETHRTVRQALDSRLKGDIRAEIAKLSTLMDAARDLKLDIREDTSILARVERLKELGKYYEAMSTVRGIETSVANKIHLHRRRAGGDRLIMATDKMAVLEREVKEIPGLDMDISELKGLLTSATTASDDSDFESAESFLDEFFVVEENYSNKVLTIAYPKEADRLDDEVKSLKEIGLVLAVAEELVNSIRENITEGHLKPIRDLRNQVLDIIEDSGKGPAKEIAKQHITGLKTSFKYLKERQVDLSEEETQFRTVLVALKDENYVKGTQLMLGVEEQLGQKRQDFFKTKIGDVLADVDKIVRQASRKNLDIRDIRKVAFEARALLKRKKYEKSMELAEKARTLLTNVWQSSLEENARLALEEIHALMEEKSGSSLELGGVEEMVGKAMGENASGEYIACLEHVEEARSTILALEQEDLMGLATERLTRAMDYISEAEETGMSTEELEREMENAQGHFDEGRYNDTVNAVNRIEEMVRTVKLTRAENRVSSQLKEFDSFIRDLDTKPYLSEDYKTDVRGKVGEVHELFENGEFLEAEDRLGDLREILEGLMAKIKLEDEFRSLVKEAGDLIARGKENEMEVSEEEEGYNQALTRKEEGDLEGAITTLLEVHESLIGTVGELLVEKAKGLFAETERVVEESRDIIEDISAFEDRLERAKECLEAGNPEGCMVLLGEIQDLLDQRRENMTIGEVEGNIARAKEELETTKNMGFDIFEIEAYIFKAFSAFQEGNYPMADDLARKAIESAQEQREGVDEGKIRIMLRNTEMLLVDCGELEIDIGVMEDGISRAERYLESRRLKDAKELTEELNAQVKERIEIKLIEVIPQHIREMSGLIDEAEQEGADMEDESMSLISIETLNEEGRYLGAMKLIGPLRAAIEEKIGAQKKEKATSKLETAFADFNEYKMTAIGDYDELETVLDEALNASTEGDAEEMERKIEAYYEIKKEYEKQWAIEKHTIGIDDMEKKLSSITELDIDISNGTELVDTAKEQLDSESMEELEVTMEELEGFVGSLFEDKIRPEAQENIKEIDRIMDRLREKGVEVKEEEELFSEILTAMDDEDHVKAHAKSSRLRVSVRSIWGHRRKDVLRDLLDELEEFLGELESNVSFSEQYKDMMRDAVDEIRDHFDAEEFDLMEEKHELFKGTVDDLKAKMKIQEEVEGLRKDAVRYGQTAEGIAADVTAELEELKKVEGMVENKEFEDAKSLLEGLLKKMKKKINMRRMSIAKMVLEDALYTFNDRKDKIDPGIVKTAQGLLSDATKLYKKGKFETAIKMATELKEGLEDAEELAPEAPPEEPVEEEKPKPRKVKLTCPKCSKSYVAKIAKTPAVAVCPYCKSKAVIKNL